MSGFDTAQQAALFSRYASRLQPDLVLVAFYWNDILSAQTSGEQSAALPEGGTQVQGNGAEPARILRMQTRRTSIEEGWLRHSRVLYVAGHGFRWLTAEPGERDSGQFATEQAILQGEDTPAIIQGWGRAEAGLEKIRSLAEAQRSSVGIVVMPCKEQVVRDYPSARYQSRAKDLGNRLGLFVIDPLPQFVDYRAKVGSLFIPYDRHHPSANGHSLIGEVVADYLQQQEGLLGSGRRTD